MDPSPAGTRWAVMMASRADKQLRRLEQEKNMLDITWTKIEELHLGQFTEDNHTPIIGTTDTIPIYRARMSADLRIIYQIDIAPEPSLKYGHQVIKVLYIDSRAQIDYGFWVQVSKSLYQRAHKDEYRDRCILRIPKSRINNFVYLPAKYTHDERMFTHEPLYLLDNYDGDQNKAAAASGLERYFPVNKALYNSILANVELNLPIVLDPLERAIVHNTKASIVIGRSGTGKTTALVYKLRAIHLQPQASSIRQMVVTRSRVLAKHIEATFRSLIESSSIANKTTAELAAMAEQYQQQSGPALIEFDNELDLREDLPSRFSLLEDSHFPLFISFEKLCSLLEGDLLAHERSQKQYKISIRDDNVIDYKKFQFEYWPKLNRTHKLGLEPAFVYSEIMGVIKGSSNSLDNPNGFLSLDQYLGSAVARRATDQLNERSRSQIYAIFEHYRKLKGERFERDSADVTRSLLKFVTDAQTVPSQDRPSGTWSPTSLVDFLYVDEVQDNLMTDIHLLRSLCKSVQNTYWGGDTAQTIVAGSAFRIRDLGTYLFNEGSSVSSKHPTSSSIVSKFDLVGNFRSHTGIVDCAASVIQALYKLFPNSLDHMEPETARWKGPPPIVFKDAGPDLSSFEQYLLTSSSGSNASFGAQQAIIVRSESIAEDLNSRLADLCPILSITDCKGLEFDDVLIYNFFSSSETPEAWDFVHDTPLKAHRNVQECAPPPSLCGELKLLYVAITRARKRCWIWDHGPVRDAMQLFWLSQGLVTIASVSEMAGWGSAISTPAEWVEKGQEYFANKMYRLAASCFDRGEQPLKAKIAAAYHQMSRAKVQMLRGDSRESRSKIREAAKALDECAKGEKTAGQLQSARHLRFHAATCLELAQETREAAKMFVAAGHHERAIRSLFGKSLVNDGVRVLLAHRGKLEVAVEQELLEYCRSYYFSECDYGSLPPLFDFSLEDELSYARKNKLRPQLKHLLKQHGHFIELAELHLEERMLMDALDAFLDDYSEHGCDSSLREGMQVAIGYAENIFGLETKKSDESLKRLKIMLNKLKPYELSLQPRHRKEFSLFYALLDKHQAVDSTWANEWDQSNLDERPRKVMLLHLALSNMDWLVSCSSANNHGLRNFLDTWKTYNALIAPILEVAEPSRLPIARRLLGFKPSRPDLYINSQFIVCEESVIYECSKLQRVPVQRNSYGAMLFPARWVDKLIRDGLRPSLDRRLRRFYDRIDRCGSIPLSPVIPRSDNHTARPSESLGSVSTSYPGYRNRLHAILIALDLISPICHVQLDGLQTGKPSLLQAWIRRLFDIMHPGDGMVGEMNPTCTSGRQSIPTGLRTCVKEYLKRVDDHSSSNTQLSSLIIGYSLAMHLGGQNLGRERFQTTNSNVQDPKPITQSDNLDLHRDSMEDHISSIFDWSKADGLTEATGLIGNALGKLVGPIDITTLVYLIELITCDMIFHIRGGLVTRDGFPSLILPFSWARLLAKRYSSTRGATTRDTSSLPGFLESIILFSEQLKFNTTRTWLMGELDLPDQSDLVEAFNLRLCWCIALLIINSSHPVVFADPVMSSLIHIAGDKYGRTPETPCQRFSSVFDRETCVQALCETFLHESIVVISDGKEGKTKWCNHPRIAVVTYSDSQPILGALQKAVRS